MEDASFLQRVASRLVDDVIVLLPCAGAYMYVARHFLDGLRGDTLIFVPIWFVAGIRAIQVYAVVSFVYYGLIQWKYGQTVGKRLLGLELVNNEGGPVSLEESIFRWLVYPLSILPLGYGIFCILWDPRRRSLHDKLADTMVIHTSSS